MKMVAWFFVFFMSPIFSAQAAEIINKNERPLLAVFFKYKLNYFSARSVATGATLNFTSAFDLETGFELKSGPCYASLGLDDVSVPGFLTYETVKKIRSVFTIGVIQELNYFISYKPYLYLTDSTFEFVYLPSIGISFEKDFYEEMQSRFGFGFSLEAIAGKESEKLSSENGVVGGLTLQYRQQFKTKEQINSKIYYTERNQDSTFYRMNEKTLGVGFTYSLDL